MITLPQIRNTGIFAFIAFLIFKLLKREVLFTDRKQQKLLKSWPLYKKIANFTGKLKKNDT